MSIKHLSNLGWVMYVQIYIRQFQDVANANEWGEATLLHLRGALEEGARDCGAAESVVEIYTALMAKYG